MEHVIVVGAGLVGTFLSASLAQRGYRVEVFDSKLDPRRSEPDLGRSVNLTLCHRGFEALDRLGAGDEVRAVSVPVLGRQMHSRDGSNPFQPYGNRGEALHSIIRRDLHKVLVSFAETRFDLRFRFRHKCLDVDLDRPAVVVKNLDTGALETIEGDRVLGADGAYSAVRLQMMKQQRFDYSQRYIAQGYKELRVPAPKVGGMKRDALHMWPREHFVLIGFPNVDGSFTLSLHMPIEGERSFATLHSEDDVLRLFETSFSDTFPRIHNLTEAFFRRRPNPMVTIRCNPWSYKDRVGLVGDAAHAIVPYYGQGVNSGFEDVDVLMDLVDDSAGDWASILPEFQRRRKPNTDLIADLSIQNFRELSSRVDDPQFLLRKALERKLNELYPEDFVPLYNMISFTSMSYVEALEASRHQQALLDDILEAGSLQLEDLEGVAASGVIDRIMNRADGVASGLEMKASTA